MDLATKIDAAAARLAAAKRVFCLTGAGVSAESGIATFRDAQTGLWSKFDPQQLASQAGFAADPGLVWRWYMDRLHWLDESTPNAGHLALADLETLLPTFTLVTQNVDNLHEQAGSQRVLHLHGSIARFRCNRCDIMYTLRPTDRGAEMPPSCIACGAYVRPDVVWFGEMLPQTILGEAAHAAEEADVALVVGTSGVVYPAAQLPYLAQETGAYLIDINPDPSEISQLADAYLQGPSGEMMPLLASATRRLLAR
jgi:NAD-dependent deacetylase